MGKLSNIIFDRGTENMRFFRRIYESNAVWAVIAVLVNCTINFFVVPYVTERVGVDAYGYVSLSNTIITYVDIISVALNSFSGRFIVILYHKGDLKKTNTYYASTFFANLIFCIVLSVVGLIGIYNIQNLLNISDALKFDVKILFVFVLARYNFVLLRTVFDTACFIKNRLDLSEKFWVISYFIQAFSLLFLCSYFQPRIWYIGMSSMFAALVLLLLQVYCVRKLTPELKLDAKLFSIPCILEIVSLGIWTAINNLGNILNSGLDLLISNKMLTGIITGNISVSKSIGSLCYTLISAVSNSFRPRQLEKYSKGDLKGLVSELKFSMRLSGSLCGIIISGFLACGADFLGLWIPTQDNTTIFNYTVIVLIGDIIIGIVNPLYYVFTLSKKVKFPCYITIFMGVINVVSMILLIYTTDLGGYIVILTTMLINLIHFFDTPLYAAHCLNLPLSTFYPEILKHLLNVTILVGIMMVMNMITFKIDSWFLLILKILMYTLVSFIVSFLVMSTMKEKRVVLDNIKKSLNH